MLFLLRLVKLVASLRASSGFGEAPEPANLPDGGASIFSTSAPMSANIIVQKAPGPTRVSSRILMPSSAPAIAPSYPTDAMRHGLDGSLVAPCRFAVFLKNGLKGDCASGSHGAPPRGVTLGVVAEVNRRGTISM